MDTILNGLVARLKEPSTWATIFCGLTALHFNIDPSVWKSITLCGMGLSGSLGIVLSEKGKEPTQVIAVDVLRQILPDLVAATQKSSANSPAATALLQKIRDKSV